MFTKSKDVIIVGGSLGGIMSGLMLKHLGHNVRIFERNPTAMLQDLGAGIVFGPEAQEYFARHVKINRRVSVPSHLRRTLDRDGKVISENDRRQEMVSWDMLYNALRACFDGVKSDYCIVPDKQKGEGDAEYLYGRKVVSVKYVGQAVEVEYQDTEGETHKETADLVLAADGPSSTIRKLLLPEVERKYVGYVAWRGTVPESEASDVMKETFVDHFMFYHAPGCQILAYLIPGKNGSVDPGSRLMNWVWYYNYPEDSPEYKDLMTDIDGASSPLFHAQEIKRTAIKDLPAAFAELVRNTEQPFVQCITDVISPKISFFNNKLLLIGDAIAGFRPHTAASTSQAAYDALLLEQNMRREITEEEMLKEMMDYAKQLTAGGIRMGNRSQFGSEGIDLKVSQQA
ncbi:FAD/NAD(P)-binding domain-containing protein [Cadophora sp. DSE1049]|nr:FAD/NAD(P)-binding domain-containing protein [Cadophora sp. DSE1049]